MTPDQLRFGVEESQRIFAQVFTHSDDNASLTFDWLFANNRRQRDTVPEVTVTLCFEGGSC